MSSLALASCWGEDYVCKPVKINGAYNQLWIGPQWSTLCCPQLYLVLLTIVLLIPSHSTAEVTLRIKIFYFWSFRTTLTDSWFVMLLIKVVSYGNVSVATYELTRRKTINAGNVSPAVLIRKQIRRNISLSALSVEKEDTLHWTLRPSSTAVSRATGSTTSSQTDWHAGYHIVTHQRFCFDKPTWPLCCTITWSQPVRSKVNANGWWGMGSSFTCVCVCSC